MKINRTVAAAIAYDAVSRKVREAKAADALRKIRDERQNDEPYPVAPVGLVAIETPRAAADVYGIRHAKETGQTDQRPGEGRHVPRRGINDRVKNAAQKCTTVGELKIDVPSLVVAPPARRRKSAESVTTMNTRPVSAADDEPAMT